MLEKNDHSKNILLYTLIVAMLIKEIYMYVACVVRADRKINKENFDSSLARGFANLLRGATSRLLND